MMKFYMTPGSCSTAIHIILEELGEIFQAHVVNLPAGDQFKPDYVAINPKSSIPALTFYQKRPPASAGAAPVGADTEGKTLTEIVAIAYWLGRARGGGRLWPQGIEAETRAIEVMSHVAGAIHGHGFTRIFVPESYSPESYSPESSARESIVAQGRALVQKGFSILDSALGDETWFCGGFSVVDPIVFYVCFWADKVQIKLPPNLLRHYRAMLARPVVQQVLREEGYRPETLGRGP